VPTCQAGFRLVGTTCTDIDECTETPSVCPANSDCTNTAGSYTCSCKTGYAESGANCVDVNECTKTPPVCPANSVCSNTIGAFACTCNSGYVLVGEVCEDINECLTSPCQNEAGCRNTPAASYTCDCKPGFTGSNCETNIDDCTDAAKASCLNGGKCVDGANSYSCDCELTGYDGPTCSDPIDDCKHYPCHYTGSVCNDLQDETSAIQPVFVKKYTCTCTPGSGPAGDDCHQVLPGYYTPTLNGSVLICPGEFWRS
jgi:hypothetical protein